MNIRVSNYVVIVAEDGIQLGLIIGRQENKVKYLTDGKEYNSEFIQKVKIQIRRNEFRFGCYQHKVVETEIYNIMEILGSVPKRRFNRIMSTKTFF